MKTVLIINYKWTLDCRIRHEPSQRSRYIAWLQCLHNHFALCMLFYVYIFIHKQTIICNVQIERTLNHIRVSKDHSHYQLIRNQYVYLRIWHKLRLSNGRAFHFTVNVYISTIWQLKWNAVSALLCKKKKHCIDWEYWVNRKKKLQSNKMVFR